LKWTRGLWGEGEGRARDREGRGSELQNRFADWFQHSWKKKRYNQLKMYPPFTNPVHQITRSYQTTTAQKKDTILDETGGLGSSLRLEHQPSQNDCCLLSLSAAGFRRPPLPCSPRPQAPPSKDPLSPAGTYLPTYLPTYQPTYHLQTQQQQQQQHGRGPRVCVKCRKQAS